MVLLVWWKVGNFEIEDEVMCWHAMLVWWTVGKLCRQNAVRLEEKEKMEKEMVKKIKEEAEEYKAEYNRKWELRCENNRAANRDKEKVRDLQLWFCLTLCMFGKKLNLFIS